MNIIDNYKSLIIFIYLIITNNIFYLYFIWNNIHKSI